MLPLTPCVTLPMSRDAVATLIVSRALGSFGIAAADLHHDTRIGTFIPEFDQEHTRTRLTEAIHVAADDVLRPRGLRSGARLGIGGPGVLIRGQTTYGDLVKLTRTLIAPKVYSCRNGHIWPNGGVCESCGEPLQEI